MATSTRLESCLTYANYTLNAAFIIGGLYVVAEFASRRFSEPFTEDAFLLDNYGQSYSEFECMTDPIAQVSACTLNLVGTVTKVYCDLMEEIPSLEAVQNAVAFFGDKVIEDLTKAVVSSDTCPAL